MSMPRLYISLFAIVLFFTGARSAFSGEGIATEFSYSLTSLTSSPDDVDENNADNTASVISTDLWQRIKNGYALPATHSDLIAVHERWYSQRPAYVTRMIERSKRYLFHIVNEVQKRGMPTEIALLPMVESAYNPRASSVSHAVGIWQFIPSTAKYFGLQQNRWIDSRRDIIVATEAALNYLQKLHLMFGTWDLALAAYNAGEGTVQRAIDKNRRLGLPTDYASLTLPEETKNYLPKLQAVKNLVNDPSLYGLDVSSIADSAYFEPVEISRNMDTQTASSLAGINHSEFLALNPAFNKQIMVNNKNQILLPVDTVNTFRQNLAVYHAPVQSWQSYYAKRGEKLTTIARKFGVGVAQLRDINNLPLQARMLNSMEILVPTQAREILTAVRKTHRSSKIKAMREGSRKIKARRH